MQKTKYLIGLAFVGGILDSALAAKTGFYAGPMMGCSTVHVSSEVISDSGAVAAYTKKRPNAFLAGGIAGWGFKSGNLYAGIELDGFYSDISKRVIAFNTSGTKESFHFKNKYQVGGGTRFGFIQSINNCTKIMPYVRMGIQIGKYQRSYIATDLSLPATFSIKKNKNIVSIVPVIGVEIIFKECVGVRAEGRYSPRTTQRLPVGSFPSNNPLEFRDSRLYISSSQRAMMLSAVYYI